MLYRVLHRLNKISNTDRARLGGTTIRSWWVVIVAIAIFQVAVPAAGAAGSVTKQPIGGLVFMGSIGFHRHDDAPAVNALTPVTVEPPGAFQGVVINIGWSQLQPRRDVFDTSAVDAALQTVRDYNTRNPATPLAVILRVWPGPNAPVWAKSLGGPPVQILHVVGGYRLPLTVGRFWTPAYRTAWRAVQAQLAARYDADPLIRQTSNTSCSTITGEPILLPVDRESIAHLLQAGFTDARFRACLLASSEDYAAWHRTPIDLFLNPYRAIDSGQAKPDVAVTRQVMLRWRQRLGARAVLGNAGLQSPLPQFLKPIYRDIKAAGPPIDLQMLSPDQRNYAAAEQLAVLLGATILEVWGDTDRKDHGFLGVTPNLLVGWSKALRTNPP